VQIDVFKILRPLREARFLGVGISEKSPVADELNRFEVERPAGAATGPGDGGHSRFSAVVRKLRWEGRIFLKVNFELLSPTRYGFGVEGF